jgi:tetratricopeptide (TPR) repeat protein
LLSGQAGITSTLDALGEITSETKGAVAVVKLLTATLPNRHFTLAGELQPAGANGPGISLELTVQEGYDSLVTFWADPLGLSKAEDLEAYQHLAIVAAAWVDHRMVNTIDGENLLSKDPRSWAFFASGLEWQRQGDFKRARQLYEQALIMDGDNIGALANLGIINKRENNFEEAKTMLGQAITATQSPDTAPQLEPAANPDWFRLKYQLAGLCANWAVATGEPATLKQLREEYALKEAKDLALMVSQTIQDQSTQEPKTKLVQFLEGTIEPDTLVLAASTLPEATTFPRPTDRPSRERVIEALHEDTIDPRVLVAFVEYGSNRSTDTVYNLACFYAIREDFNRATEHLLEAVRGTQLKARKGLVEGVKLDPTLASLRKRFPALLLKLEELARETPSDPDTTSDTGSVEQFDLERQAIKWLESEGWEVGWGDPQDDLILSKRHDREEHDREELLSLVKNDSISIADVNALIVARDDLRGSQDGAVQAMLVAPESKLSPNTAGPDLSAILKAAEDKEIEIYGAGELGFKRVTTTPG